MPGRLITDDVLVAYESYHAIKKKKVGKYGTCAIKLDMHKSYDRVEWAFLERILAKMGFDVRWINLVMACVSSMTYQVRFNGQETDPFLPTRGLRLYAKVIPCHHIFSSFVRRDSQVCFKRRRIMVKS